MAKKAAKRGKGRSGKTRAQSGKKAAKPARRKTAKPRRKADKPVSKTTKKPPRSTAKKPGKKAPERAKAPVKAIPPRSVEKPVEKPAQKPAKTGPAEAPKQAAKTTGPALPPAAQRGGEGGRPRPSVRPTAPRQQSQPQPRGAGKVDNRIYRYFAMVAQNTPEAYRLGARQLDAILAEDPENYLALAERAHSLINHWRNGASPDSDLDRCRAECGTADTFACALRLADRSIAASEAQNVDNPYGYWAKAYAYKYQRDRNRAVENYRIALSFDRSVFVTRPKKHLRVEFIEGRIYWANRGGLRALVQELDHSDNRPDPTAKDKWLNWVRCFALHLLGDFAASVGLYPDRLPTDEDVSLILAASYARMSGELNAQQRRYHRDRFLNKDGGGNLEWNAELEIERSPFADQAMRDFWQRSVELALAPDAATSGG